MQRKYRELWETCVAFHGHACGGLAVGFRAALYAMELLGLDGRAEDEEIVCVAENDACGVDAIQVILGCSVGKGNLLFHICGKQAFSFYDRGSGRSVRLVLKEKPREMTKAESFAYYQACEPREMFDVKETFLALPRKAETFGSARCGCCGEMTGEKWLREAGGKKLCPDCLARLSGK